MAYTTDADRWRALTTRDANANGHFVYSVKTTNVYCRPTCPARLARRANVGFYKTPLEAEADGFRACKRCKPNTVLEDPQDRAVEKAYALIEEAVKNNDHKAFRLQDLAKNVGLTPRYFHKIFKDKTGQTPNEYAKSREMLQNKSSATSAADLNPVDIDTANWNIFDFNDFEDLVDFDPDASATLGYNLMTGAAQPSAMGFGNAIDVNILHQMWSAEYEPNGIVPGSLFEDGKFVSALDPIGLSSTSDWQASDRFISPVSTFEPDAAALLGCGSLRVLS